MLELILVFLSLSGLVWGTRELVNGGHMPISVIYPIFGTVLVLQTAVLSVYAFRILSE